MSRNCYCEGAEHHEDCQMNEQFEQEYHTTYEKQSVTPVGHTIYGLTAGDVTMVNAAKKPHENTFNAVMHMKDGIKEYKEVAAMSTEVSDGTTADYYELPKDAKELQDLISFKDMNGQVAEMFRALYRYGQVSHSPMERDIKKIIYYAEAELDRLQRYT